MLKEFKEFALRGNVVDMAVGIIIGAAFSTIVKSLVDDLIMPPIGVLTGGVDFSNMFVSLNGEHYNSLAQARQAGAPILGVFINNVISFMIVAFVLFMVIKGMNHAAQAGGGAGDRAAAVARGAAVATNPRWSRAVRAGSGRRAHRNGLKAQQGFCVAEGRRRPAIAPAPLKTKNFYSLGNMGTILRLFAGRTLLGE